MANDKNTRLPTHFNHIFDTPLSFINLKSPIYHYWTEPLRRLLTTLQFSSHTKKKPHLCIFSAQKNHEQLILTKIRHFIESHYEVPKMNTEMAVTKS